MYASTSNGSTLNTLQNYVHVLSQSDLYNHIMKTRKATDFHIKPVKDLGIHPPSQTGLKIEDL